MHVDRSAGWHVNTSEVKQGWSVAFVDYGMGISALQRSRLVRHGWGDVYAGRQVGRSILQKCRIGQARLEGCLC